MAKEQKILICIETAAQINQSIKRDLEKYGHVQPHTVEWAQNFAQDDSRDHSLLGFRHWFGFAPAQKAGEEINAERKRNSAKILGI